MLNICQVLNFKEHSWLEIPLNIIVWGENRPVMVLFNLYSVFGACGPLWATESDKTKHVSYE